MWLMNIHHEVVVCRLFPYTFENKASTLFFYLEEASITIWSIFEITSLEKFGEDKTPATLVLDISRIKMEPKEKIKYFNQWFLTLMKRISQASRLVEYVFI